MRTRSFGFGGYFGLPGCCVESYYERRLNLGIEDACVAIALSSRQAGGSSVMELSIPFETNVLWRSIGVMAVPHQPCSPDCPSSIDLSRSLVGMGTRMGYAAEMEWLECMLQWPVDWSCLHGIAELVTPVFRASTATDATSKKLTLRLTSQRHPLEGSPGADFPFITPDFTCGN